MSERSVSYIVFVNPAILSGAGLTAVVVAALLLLSTSSLRLPPPSRPFAAAPAITFVGYALTRSLGRIGWDDLTGCIPAMVRVHPRHGHRARDAAHILDRHEDRTGLPQLCAGQGACRTRWRAQPGVGDGSPRLPAAVCADVAHGGRSEVAGADASPVVIVTRRPEAVKPRPPPARGAISSQAHRIRPPCRIQVHSLYWPSPRRAGWSGWSVRRQEPLFERGDFPW